MAILNPFMLITRLNDRHSKTRYIHVLILFEKLMKICNFQYAKYFILYALTNSCINETLAINNGQSKTH